MARSSRSTRATASRRGRTTAAPTSSLPPSRPRSAMRVRTFVASAALVAATAVPAAAANKEHQQMMAEIRMLQEQNLQLQQTIGTLVDALKTVTTKIDDQSAAT